MATLNIKSFPDDLYTDLRERAQREHRSLTQQVIHLLTEAVARPEPTSILELRGLGKSLWEDIDAAEYVESERASWD